MRRGRILILIGLILACGTAAVAFMLIQQMMKTPVASEIKREEVVVAVQPIAEDEVVDGRLELRPEPVEAIPEGAVRSLDETTGLLAAGPIPQGAIIQPSMLQSKEQQMQEGNLSQLIDTGYLAVAFPISELSSVSYGVQPDDRVDILMTFTFIDLDTDSQSKEPVCPAPCPATSEGGSSAATLAQIPRLATQLTLQDVRVLGLGRWTYQPPPPEEGQPYEGDGKATSVEPPQYITFMLTPQDALVLKLAREQGATIELAVRQRDDHQMFTTQQVTLEYLMSRFGVTVPTKREFTIELLPPR